MREHKSVKITKRTRLTPEQIKLLVYRVLPIILVVVLSVSAFSICEKKISEIIAQQKYSSLAQRGTVDDPLLSDYEQTNVDWTSAYSSLDPDGFDPLDLSPLGVVDDIRPSSSLSSNIYERYYGYSNKQSKIWSIHDSVNSDISAWIYMYGLGINYPVAQETADNKEYYLTHTYDKAKSTSGTIYIPSECSINPISKNLILFGHNMRDNTMFATLENYLIGTKSYFDSHKYIFLDTLYGTYRYEIYSVYKTTPDDIYLRTGFTSNSDFLSWCTQTEQRSQYKNNNITFSASDRTITLSTCDDTAKYRIIVHAKLVFPIATDDIDETYSPDIIPNGGNISSDVPDQSTSPNDKYDFKVDDRYIVTLKDHTSTMRLRSAPSTTSQVVGSLAHGTQVSIVENKDKDWVKVKTIGGMEGYMLKQYLVFDEDFSFTIPTATVAPPETNLVTPTPTLPPKSTPTVEPTVEPTPTVAPTPEESTTE